MPITVQIDVLTGAGPTATAAGSATLGRDDNVNSVTPTPAPSASPATKFSWVKTFQLEITATGGLTMTNIRVGRVAAETVAGTKLWHTTANGAYTQATGAPSDTADNNVTAPTINGQTATAPALISAPPAVYSAGGHSTTGRKGNMVEVVVGVDATCVITGTSVALPTLRWVWVEA